MKVINENLDVIEQLREVVRTKQRAKIKFQNGSTMLVDIFSASAILSAHQYMVGTNKEKFERMLNRGPQNFLKVLDFSVNKG